MDNKQTTVTVGVEVINQIFQYLVSKPYSEVYHLIEMYTKDQQKIAMENKKAADVKTT